MLSPLLGAIRKSDADGEPSEGHVAASTWPSPPHPTTAVPFAQDGSDFSDGTSSHHNDFYPLTPQSSPAIGASYSSPQTDSQRQRPGSSEFLSPCSGSEHLEETAAAAAAGFDYGVGAPLHPSLDGVGNSPPERRRFNGVREDEDEMPCHGGGHPLLPQQRAAASPPLSCFSSTPFHGSANSGGMPVMPHGEGNNAPGMHTTASPLSLDNTTPSPAGSHSVSAAAPLAQSPDCPDAESEGVHRSTTREGHCCSPTPRSSSSPSTSSSCSLPSSSQSCPLPLEAPPDSAIKSPAGLVALREGGLTLPQRCPSPRQYRVMYTEVSHRVELEMHETEERRCVFQAFRAILSVYRMWEAAEVEEGKMTDYGDASVAVPLTKGCERSSRLPLLEAPSTPPRSWATVVSGGDRSVKHAASSAASRVQSLLSLSITKARTQRNSGSEQPSASAPSAQLIVSPASHSVAHVYPDAEAPRSPLYHNSQPHPSQESSLATSRVLNYSSMVQAEAPSTVSVSEESSRVPLRPHYFSSWRTEGVDRQKTTHPHYTPFVPSLDRRDGRAPHHQSATTASLVPRIHHAPSSPSALHFDVSTLSTQARDASRGFCETASKRSGSAGVTVSAPAAGLSGRVSTSLCGGARSLPTLGTRIAEKFCNEDGGCKREALDPYSPNQKVDLHQRSLPMAGKGCVSLLKQGRQQRDIYRLQGEEEARLRPTSPHSVNKVLPQRQRVALRGGAPNSSSTADDSPISKGSEWCLNRYRERRESYIQYRRFFDTRYGGGSTSPSLREASDNETEMLMPGALEPASVVPQPTPFRSHSGSATPTAGEERAQRILSRPAAPTCHLLQGSNQLPSKRPAQRGWTSAKGRGAASKPNELPAVSALLPSRALTASFTGMPRSLITSAEGAVVVARLMRLSTLEKLCRAELQRRWMEDQNILLHLFIMEGTSTLRRLRVAAATVPRIQLIRKPGVAGVATVPAEAPSTTRAWHIITNEIGV